MNGNSSKQVLLSVLGIAILVVAVVGVSFAFFSYTKTGSTVNTISTGQIYTYLTNGDTMTLANAMPVQTTPTQVLPATSIDPETSQPTGGTTGDIGVLSFSVTGINQSDTAITYKIYLVEGLAASIPADRHNLIADSDIGLLMSSTGTGAATPITTATDVGAKITANGGSTLSDGALLGTGTFAANTNSETTHTYTINMWVRGDNVKISDTDLSVNGTAPKYCASVRTGNPESTTASGNHGCELYMNNGTLASVAGMTPAEVTAANIDAYGTENSTKYWLPVYSDSYYMARVRIVANTNATNTNVDYPTLP